jgi:hypothetical protein
MGFAPDGVEQPIRQAPDGSKRHLERLCPCLFRRSQSRVRTGAIALADDAERQAEVGFSCSDDEGHTVTQHDAEGLESTAFLIIAHHEPELLRRLVGRIDAPWSHAFIHVSKSSAIESFQDLTPASDQVTYLSDRVTCHWCGYSVVEAIFRLLLAAVSHERRFTRFVLLSGVDYPIKPLPVIGKRLAPDVEQIQVSRKVDPAGDTVFDLRARRIFLGDNALTNPRTAPRLINRLVRRIEALTSRKFPDDTPLYEGPTWWALTRDAVEHCLEVRRNQPSYVNWFRGVEIPDEYLFQTILMASDRADLITQCYQQPATIHDYIHGIHYVDFASGNPALPRTFVLEDYGRLVQSEALFARKFSLERSGPLLDLIDQEIHGGVKPLA